MKNKWRGEKKTRDGKRERGKRASNKKKNINKYKKRNMLKSAVQRNIWCMHVNRIIIFNVGNIMLTCVEYDQLAMLWAFLNFCFKCASTYVKHVCIYVCMHV